MNRYRKIGIAVCFFLILVIVLSNINEIIRYKEPYGIVQYDGFYKQERNTIDVLFMGTSHVYCDIDPAYIYDETGILSYDLATGGAGIWCTYYSLRQALKYQKPKVVVIEIWGGVRGDYNLSQREIVDATYRIRNPLIKYEALKTLCDGTDNSIFEFWLAFPWYHTLYTDVNKYDFKDYSNVACLNNNDYAYLYPNGNLKAYKGAVTRLAAKPCKSSGDVRTVTDEENLSEKAEKYIYKIIDLANEEGIQVCFVSSPYSDAISIQRRVNYIKNTICREEGCDFIDANCAIDEIGIDWSSDFTDPGHLNCSGSEKYSRWLSEILSDTYELEDKRGTVEAGSWEENLKWQNEVIAAKRLTEITNFPDYISKLDNENYMVLVSFCGENYDDYRSMMTCEEGVDGLVMDGGQYHFHYKDETEFIMEDGKDTFMIATDIDGSGIFHNGIRIANEGTEGIEIVVYDKWLHHIIDTVHISGRDLELTR